MFAVRALVLLWAERRCGSPSDLWWGVVGDLPRGCRHAVIARGTRHCIARRVRVCRNQVWIWDRKIRDLMLLTMFACLCLILAWARDDELFAAVFAVEAAFAGIEAVYLSL